MPTAAPHPCNKPGCGALTQDRFCPTHQQAIARAYDRERGSAASRGYGSRWRRYRAAYLLHHPLCVDHLARGETVAATVVDHIVPHKGDQTLMWDERNHQALCKTCHDTKTAVTDGRWVSTPGGP